MDYKIIQVIPNTKDVCAEYQDGKVLIYSPIVCFALIEWEDGERAVRPMDLSSDGQMSFPDEAKNFKKIF